MKIAFIGQKGIGGEVFSIEKHVEEVAVRMAALGHEVFVYARYNYTDKNLKEYKGVKLIYLPSIKTKHLEAISHTFFATVHAIFSHYDVVHFQAIESSVLIWMFRIFKPRTALVATFHCQDYFHQKWGWFAQKCLRLGEWMTCNVPHKTIVVSKVLGTYVKETYKKKVVLIPNGTGVRYGTELNILTSWNLKKKKYVLFVGRLVKQKGVHYLIEAFKQLEDTSKLPNNFKLVIAGDGFHSEEYVEYLHAIAKGRENIIFIGEQKRKNSDTLFAYAYMFVQPSEAEGLPVVLLKAMNFGLCVLASDIFENKELLGEAGQTFENKSVTDLRDKLAFLLNRPEEVRKFGQKAKQRNQKEHSWDSIVQKTLGVYEEIIKSWK